jgi:hypothetical protein
LTREDKKQKELTEEEKGKDGSDEKREESDMN